MSLKQQLLDAGVNLSDMARDIPGENYPNLYEVLRKEERGMPIRPASAQDARLGKLRAYLGRVLDGTVRVVDSEEAGVDDEGRVVEVGLPDAVRRQTTRPVPRGMVLVRDPVRIKGTLCGPGTVLNLSMAHGPLNAGAYVFLRALARADEPSVPVEIELYGGPGYLRAKTDPKTGFPTHYASHRTVRPDAFRRARPAIPIHSPEDGDD